MRRYHLFVLLLLVVALLYGSPSAGLLLNRAIGSWSADAIQQDGSVTHMVFDTHLPPADFIPVFPGASVVQRSRLVSQAAPGGFNSLELAVHGSAAAVRDFYRSRLAAEGFSVDDLGMQGLNPAAAAYLGVAGTLSAKRPATDDSVVVQIRTEEGLVLPSRLIQISWRKLSEWPKDAPKP